MSKRRGEIDMKLLMFAIQRTTSFEQLLASRFIGKTIQKPVDVNFSYFVLPRDISKLKINSNRVEGVPN